MSSALTEFFFECCLGGNYTSLWHYMFFFITRCHEVWFWQCSGNLDVWPKWAKKCKVHFDTAPLSTPTNCTAPSDGISVDLSPRCSYLPHALVLTCNLSLMSPHTERTHVVQNLSLALSLIFSSLFVFPVFNSDMRASSLTLTHTRTQTLSVIKTNQGFSVCKCQVISVLQSPPV